MKKLLLLSLLVTSISANAEYQITNETNTLLSTYYCRVTDGTPGGCDVSTIKPMSGISVNGEHGDIAYILPKTVTADGNTFQCSNYTNLHTKYLILYQKDDKTFDCYDIDYPR